MIRTALGFFAALTGLGVVGHFDQESQMDLDAKYCEMVSVHERYREAHRGEVGREAALRRPGWPAHRDDIDCREHGFSQAYTFSKH